jgi:hypothetical protein
MLVHAGIRWSQWPGLPSAAVAGNTSRTRSSSPRQRRSAQALARWPIDWSTRARQLRLHAVERPLCLAGSVFPTGVPVVATTWPCPGTQVHRLATWVTFSTRSGPHRASSSCSWRLATSPSHHGRSPWTVDAATPGRWRHGARPSRQTLGQLGPCELGRRSVQGVASASVGTRRAARMAGYRPASAPMTKVAATPPPMTQAGTTVGQPCRLA